MIDSLLKIIEKVRIEYILAGLGFYLLILWFLIPVWVYMDAKKKFNDRLALVFFILTLPLNIPGLIFYIIIRPDEENSDSNDETVIGIPIVNFLSADQKDLVMSLELKINGNLIANDKKHDLKLDVSIDSNNDNILISNETLIKKDIDEAILKEDEVVDANGYVHPIKKIIKMPISTMSKFKSGMFKIRNKQSETEESESADGEEIVDSEVEKKEVEKVEEIKDNNKTDNNNEVKEEKKHNNSNNQIENKAQPANNQNSTNQPVQAQTNNNQQQAQPNQQSNNNNSNQNNQANKQQSDNKTN
jgi:hypothetical protein